MEIWESLRLHLSDLLTNWQVITENYDQYNYLGMSITKAGFIRPPISMILIEDEVSIYADKDNSTGYFHTYGSIGHYCLADPSSIEDITSLINLRLTDYE